MKRTSSLDSSGKARCHWTLVMLCTASLWSFSAIAQDPCTSIPMPSGQNAAEVSGIAPGHGRDDDPGIQCYSLAVSRGQPVHVRLMGGENVAITIPDVGDARDEFEFVAKQDRYELHVFQLFPGGGDEAFRIEVRTGGARSGR